MVAHVYKAPFSTWVNQAAPNVNHATGTFIGVDEGSGTTCRGYFYLAITLPAGAVISSAILTLTATNAASGIGTLSLTKVTSSVPVAQKTWNRQPTLGTVGAAGTTVTPAGGATVDGQALNFDITTTVQGWVGGSPNYGLQLRNSGTTRYAVYGANSAHPPFVTITYTTPPDTPHNLMPNGVVSGTKPVVTFGPYGDPDGDLLQAIQVQVASSPTSFGTPTFDSGTVAASDPSLDLSTTSFSGFNGTPQYWRARVEDASGAWSAWSDPASVTVTAKPTVTFSSPSVASPIVNEVTPQIVWSASGMTSFVARILDGTTRAILTESSHITSNVGQWGVPAHVIEAGGSYIAQVDVYDLTRSPSPGDPIYTRQEQAFTFVPGASPAPSAITIAPGPDWPGQVVIQCTETTAPDYFTVYLDGKVALAQVSPGSALVSGTTYGFTIDHCPTGLHTFQIDAVTAGVASVPSAPVQYENVISGIWLGDPVRKIWAMVSATGTSPDQWSMKDNVTITQPIDGSVPQQIIRFMGGVSGTCTGILSEKSSALSVAQREANLMALKSLPQNTLRLVYGSKNIPVKVSNLSVVQASDSSADNPRRVVSFDFFQCAEFPFSVNL